MHAKPRRTKAVISTRVRNQKLLSNSYWKNIKRRVKKKVLIGQVVQRHQDHPQGTSTTTGIGEKTSSTKQVHILLLGHQYKGHGHLPMLIIIHIHHGTCMIHGNIIHIILDRLTRIMQLQIDHHWIKNYVQKTVSIKKNRFGAQRKRRRWSSKFTV